MSEIVVLAQSLSAYYFKDGENPEANRMDEQHGGRSTRDAESRGQGEIPLQQAEVRAAKVQQRLAGIGGFERDQRASGDEKRAGG